HGGECSSPALVAATDGSPPRGTRSRAWRDCETVRGATGERRGEADEQIGAVLAPVEGQIAAEQADLGRGSDAQVANADLRVAWGFEKHRVEGRLLLGEPHGNSVPGHRVGASPGTASVDRLAVDVEPGAEPEQAAPLKLVDAAVGPWADVQQEVAVFAHDVDQEPNDFVGR